MLNVTVICMMQDIIAGNSNSTVCAGGIYMCTISNTFMLVSDKDGGNNTLIIILGVIVPLIILIATVAVSILAVYWMRKRQGKNSSKQSYDLPENTNVLDDSKISGDAMFQTEQLQMKSFNAQSSPPQNDYQIHCTSSSIMPPTSTTPQSTTASM